MNVWQFIYNKFTGGARVILLYVLESTGSSPGRQGFKMAVADDNTVCGSIGGGIMEHKFVEMTKARLKESVSAKSVHKQLHSKEAAKDQSGMICSGEQTIFLYELKQKDVIEIERLLQRPDGSIRITGTGISLSPDYVEDAYSFSKGENDFLLIEKAGFKNILYIIGGGHCCLALSKLMRELDFYIHVYDDREGLSTLEQNHFAHKTAVAPYTSLANLVEEGNNIYVVIMTAGYRTDDIALRSLLEKRVRYIGMLGSKKKIETLFDQYEKEGIRTPILDSLRAPVGLAINSQTPAEIAISIAAEIISVKNKA